LNLDLLSSVSKAKTAAAAAAAPISSIAEAKNYALLNLLSGGTGKSMRSAAGKSKK